MCDPTQERLRGRDGQTGVVEISKATERARILRTIRRLCDETDLVGPRLMRTKGHGRSPAPPTR